MQTIRIDGAEKLTRGQLLGMARGAERAGNARLAAAITRERQEPKGAGMAKRKRTIDRLMEATGQSGPDLSKPWCWYITGASDKRGFIPSIVVENDPGHYPSSDDPATCRLGYRWGKTQEEAEAAAEAQNARHGIDTERAAEIVASSMWPKAKAVAGE